MSNQIIVGISDFKVAHSPDTLVTYALGSCIGISLYDKKSGIGGLAHIILPESSVNQDVLTKDDRKKFADTAVVQLLEEMLRAGADREQITARIVGGANMFKIPVSYTTSKIGMIAERNIDAVRTELKRLGIPLIGEDIGGDYGRTVFFYLETGRIMVQSLIKGTKEL